MSKPDLNNNLITAKRGHSSLNSNVTRSSKLLAHTIISSVAEGIVVYNQNLIYQVWNPYMERMTGVPARDILGKRATDVFPHVLEHGVDKLLMRVLKGEHVTTQDMPYHIPQTGKRGWAVSHFTPLFNSKGKVVGIVGVVNDISERKRIEILELNRIHILEMVARNEPVEQTLTELTLSVEQHYPDIMCSIALLNEGRLRYVAAPNLPKVLIETTNNLELNADLSAALSGQAPVLKPDGSHDRNWLVYRSLLAKSGIVSIWSVPITTSDKEAQGVITLWFKEQHTPSASDRSHLNAMARLAAVALEQHHLLERLTYQATHDSLTGLLNRFSFETHLENALESAKEDGRILAVLFVDLDRFKTINDTLGHSAGDELLKEVAKRLRARTRQQDLISRMGGDEFALILEDISSPEAATIVAKNLLQLLSRPYEIVGHELYMTASIGVSLFPEDGEDVTTLLSNVDSAMYQAKAEGKNRFHSFLPELNAAAFKRLEVETQIRRALEQGEFELHYQPKINLTTGEILGFEALIRWRHPTRGLLFPGEFIPIAEESGLIIEIGDWVLQEATQQAVRWQKEGHPIKPVAVNVSALQFARTDFVENVFYILEESGLEACWLEIELTESAVMHNIDSVAKRLQALRDFGVLISIDDFGTGYSSMAYLQQLPIDTLKIDRSFIKDIEADVSSKGPSAFVQAIITLAYSLDLMVVAEGIELEEQSNLLRRIGCDAAQGYYFSKPLPANQVWSQENLALAG